MTFDTHKNMFPAWSFVFLDAVIECKWLSKPLEQLGIIIMLFIYPRHFSLLADNLKTSFHNLIFAINIYEHFKINLFLTSLQSSHMINVYSYFKCVYNLSKVFKKYCHNEFVSDLATIRIEFKIIMLLKNKKKST